MALQRRNMVVGAACLIALAAAPAQAQQAWPTRPVRLLVAFAPGGFTDIAARILAERLSAELGQQVVVDNRAGAGGIVGTEAAARSAPDGYTLLMGTISTHAMNVGLYRNLPYDPVRHFAPVSRVATSPNLFVAHPSTGASDVAGLIARAKERPGTLTYGSGGNGTSQPSRRRAVQDLGWRGPAARALPQHRAGHLRARRGSGGPDVRHAALGAAACARGAAACPRRHRAAALGRTPRAAGGCGDGAGLRDGCLGRAVRTRRHAAA